MSWIDLGVPRLRNSVQSYVPISWSIEYELMLPKPNLLAIEKLDILSLLQTRRTCRDFKSISIEKLADLFGLAFSVQFVGNDALGFPLQKRSYPSAGAIHPIHILFVRPDDNTFYRYNGINHSIEALSTSVKAQHLLVSAVSVLNAPNATLILLAAEVNKVSTKYENFSSLVWRDSGVILGHLSLLTEALNLCFCPLGITGEPWVGSLFEQGKLVGVGAAFVGVR